MKAVWSFWSKPNREHTAWASHDDHLLSWGLSVFTAAQHFKDLQLVTDRAGAGWLVEEARLPFTDVRVVLDDLDVDPRWYMASKLLSHTIQMEPYVHIDADAYLWQPLPPRLLTAPVFTQSPMDNDPTFGIAQIIAELPKVPSAWARAGDIEYAGNCGIIGGVEVEFLQLYAERAFGMMNFAPNALVWDHHLSTRGTVCNVLVEEHLLARLLHASKRELHYLTLDWPNAMNPELSEGSAITHLMGVPTKRNASRWLNEKVAEEYPDFYNRVKTGVR